MQRYDNELMTESNIIRHDLYNLVYKNYETVYDLYNSNECIICILFA